MRKLLALSLAAFLSCTAAFAQVPPVNSGSAVYPSSGNIAAVLTGTTSAIGGGLLSAGVCASGTVAVANSTTSMVVGVSPNTYPGDGTIMYGYVSTNGTVTVKVCGIVAVTPASSTYNVRVMQ